MTRSGYEYNQMKQEKNKWRKLAESRAKLLKKRNQTIKELTADFEHLYNSRPSSSGWCE
jgi:hypothetical protein